jgi:hypothetical protein
LRRLYFDLIGLPPTPEEVEAFVGDGDPQALERVVDRLLDSAHFGERWGRHWLDLVRYAESRGHEFDYDVPGAWHYRDYVIRALNADVPYDQFVVEHIAGDLLPQPRMNPEESFNESILGAGFWFLGEWVHSPVDIRQDEMDRVDNMLDVASKTFLGITLACARCHDHKFDAISQRDYYAMAGFLQSTTYRQACFDSMEQNARVAAEWNKAQEATRPKLAAAFVDSRKGAVERLAAYLQAARKDVIESEATDEGLKPELLARWVDHLRRAKSDPSDPFHAWAKVQGDAPFAATREEQLAAAASQRQRAKEALAGCEVIVDYAKALPEEWMTDGPTFGSAPVAAGTIVLGDRAEAPLRQIAAYAAVRRDPLWNGLRPAPGDGNEPGRSGAWRRAGRTFRTPTFTIAAENVYYLVSGSAHVYAVVDSHRANNGPLHGSLIAGFEGVAAPAWIAQPLGRYRGHRAHLEFSAKGDDPLEVLMVVQGDRPPGNPLEAPNEPLTQLLAGAASPEELAKSYQSLFTDVLEDLSDGRLESSAADAAEVANWLVEHPELTVEDGGQLTALQSAGKELLAARERIAAQIKYESRTAPAMWEAGGVDEFLLIRGNPRTPGEVVPRRFLEALAGPEPLTSAGSGRLELARQIASPENPLTARVLVNRVWHHLLGRGIVASVDNFGVLGESPSHPELLDYLAGRFVDDGWSIKRLIRSIVLSRTYQMASLGEEAAVEADPTNLLFHRMPVRRLEGEAIRDAILAVSGRLDRTMYGPSIPVHLTPFMQGRGRPAQSGPLDGAGRRSIYGAVRRNFLSPMMLAFDTPAPFSTMGRRNVSNVPAQALILMNDPFVVEQARLWAERELREKDLSPEDHLSRLYLTAFARAPSDAEAAAAMAFLQRQASEMGRGADAAKHDPQVWAELCHALLNLKEFIFIR